MRGMVLNGLSFLPIFFSVSTSDGQRMSKIMYLWTIGFLYISWQKFTLLGARCYIVKLNVVVIWT